jgi:hypothetical protein
MYAILLDHIMSINTENSNIKCIIDPFIISMLFVFYNQLYMCSKLVLEFQHNVVSMCYTCNFNVTSCIGYVNNIFYFAHAY